MSEEERERINKANARIAMLRGYVDAHDEQLAKTLAERFDLVREIAVLKRDVNLPIYSPGREAQIFNRLITSRYQKQITEIFKAILTQSRLEMYELMEKLSCDE